MADLTDHFNNSQESEDTLSLCDLPLYEDDFQPDLVQDLESQPDLFEFSVDPNTETISNTNIIFCGKSIPSRSDSVKKSRCTKSGSGSGNFRYYGNSRQRKVLIGLAKFPTEMELSDMRRRQNRKIPTPMFAVDCDGETAVDGGDSGGGKGHWGLFRLLIESHIGSAFTKAVSFGCFSVV